VNEVLRAAAELQAVCESNAWKYCFIGGVALQRWGEPRETVDVDVTLLTGFEDVQPFIETLLARFEGRIPDAGQFARERRVLLLKSAAGVGLDIALAALPYEELLISRSSIFEYPMGIQLRTCSAEDLLVLKAFAGRSQDWVDVERIIVRQTGLLDWNYVNSNLAPLAALKEAPTLLEELARRRAEFDV
jgi:hypothetical protein